MQNIKIKSIKRIPKNDRYDLTIGSTKNFFANGILIHNTSAIASHVLVKRNLNFLERTIIKLRIKFGKNPAIWKHLPEINQEEYGFVFASRKVIKSVEGEAIIGDSFYDSDLWTACGEKMKEFIPKGYTIYYEIVGYTPSGSAIQSKYDYGCKQGEHKVYVYRITQTTPDGQVFNLGTKECQEFCLKSGLDFVPLFFHGKAEALFGYQVDNHSDDDWQKDFVKFLEEEYNEKDCYICKNKVPEEGIVIRKEKMSEFEAYKLKSFRFLEFETKELDKGEENIEDSEN